MEKIVSFTVKVPVSVHKKLKLIALLSEKSMTDVLIDWVNNTTNVIPDILVKPSKAVKAGKPSNAVTPVKPGKSKMIVRKKAVKDDIQKSLPSYGINRDKTITRIMKMHDEGLKPYSIAKTLNAEGIPTLRGGKKWGEATVKGIIKRELVKREADK